MTDEGSSKETFHLWARTTLQNELPPMPLAEFWSWVEKLGWERRTVDFRALARQVAHTRSLEETLRAANTAEDLAAELLGELLDWCGRNDVELGIGEEESEWLCQHVVGLGAQAFDAALREPSLLLARARQGAYAESFLYVFTLASTTYREREWSQALKLYGRARPYDPDQTFQPGELIEHPSLGLGFVEDVTPLRAIFARGEGRL